MALVWLWCGFEVALGSQSVGYQLALEWLWGGFVLRSICLVYAYYMALRWLWVASPRLKRSRAASFEAGLVSEPHLHSRPLDRRHILEAWRVGPFLLIRPYFS